MECRGHRCFQLEDANNKGPEMVLLGKLRVAKASAYIRNQLLFDIIAQRSAPQTMCQLECVDALVAYSCPSMLGRGSSAEHDIFMIEMLEQRTNRAGCIIRKIDDVLFALLHGISGPIFATGVVALP
jgi:hypothetical protein